MTDAPVWEVFLTPHTDDEVIGMAGAITRAHVHGVNVLVVLVTDNVPSARGTRLFPIDNLIELRRVEWKKAMTCLDVDATEMWEISEQQMVMSPIDVQRDIEDRIESLNRRLSPQHIHTVCGSDDIHAESGYGSIAHILCANAAANFARKYPHVRVSLHGIYVYSKPKDDRTHLLSHDLLADQLTPKEREKKRQAIACYRQSADTIGYGYKSVPELLDNAENDEREYVVEITYNHRAD